MLPVHKYGHRLRVSCGLKTLCEMVIIFFIRNQNKHAAVNPVKAVSASLWTSFNLGSAARTRIFVVHVVSISVAVLPRNAS